MLQGMQYYMIHIYTVFWTTYRRTCTGRRFIAFNYVAQTFRLYGALELLHGIICRLSRTANTLPPFLFIPSDALLSVPLYNGVWHSSAISAKRLYIIVPWFQCVSISKESISSILDYHTVKPDDEKVYYLWLYSS